MSDELGPVMYGSSNNEVFLGRDFSATPNYSEQTAALIDSEIEKGHIPDCIFLSGFDQFLLGYEKNESLILPGEHIRDIYTLAGIARPALLIDGKVAGYWNLKNKKLSITMFENGNEEKIKSEANVIWTDLKEIKFT